MKIGLCTGCFDRFHAGHGYFLQEAALRCDHLIVAVNTDASVRKLKGDSRPFEKLWDRLERVSGLSWVDAAIPFNGNDEMLALLIKPDVIFRGWDQSEKPSTFPIVRIGRGPDTSTSSRA